MNKPEKKKDYPTVIRLTLLQSLGLLALVGLVLTAVLRYFFG